MHDCVVSICLNPERLLGGDCWKYKSDWIGSARDSTVNLDHLADMP